MLNNLGVCKLELDEHREAEQFFQAALALDPKYPMPYFNLALLAQLRGELPLANELARKAKELGYSRSTADHLVHKASSLLARMEGRGV